MVRPPKPPGGPSLQARHQVYRPLSQLPSGYFGKDAGEHQRAGLRPEQAPHLAHPPLPTCRLEMNDAYGRIGVAIPGLQRCSQPLTFTVCFLRARLFSQWSDTLTQLLWKRTSADTSLRGLLLPQGYAVTRYNV